MDQPTPRPRRRGAAALVALLTAGVCVATAVSASALRGVESSPPTVAAAPGVSWPSGAYCGSSDPTCVTSFAAWRGRAVTATTTFTGSKDWSGLEGPDSWLSDWAKNPYRSVVVVTVPMIPTTGDADDPTPTLAEEATGAYDSHFVRLAQRLVSAGMGTATIRLGHELNGAWYGWSARPDPAAYAAAWRDVVRVMRGVAGASFSFDWNVAVGAGLNVFDARTAYPGDDYVDTVGVDVYDGWWGQPLSPEARWAKLVDPGGAVPQGLQFWADFAAAHGKPNSFPEWGLVGAGSSMGNGGEGDDDPYYIARMHDWFATHPTASEIYFNRNPSDGSHRIDDGAFPQAAQTYVELFGGPGVSATPSPSTSPSPGGCDQSPSLFVSTDPSRDASVPLCGATLHGTVYVFARGVGATAASFFVDNPGRGRAPTTLDLSSPYDLMGTTSSGSAKPWDVSTLEPGTHTVTVLLPTPRGSVVETATFTVTAS